MQNNYQFGFMIYIQGLYWLLIIDYNDLNDWSHFHARLIWIGKNPLIYDKDFPRREPPWHDPGTRDRGSPRYEMDIDQ